MVGDMNSFERINLLAVLSKNARKHPEMFVGSVEIGHVQLVEQMLKTVLLTDAFHRVNRIRLAICGHTFYLKIWSKGLKAKYSQLIDWDPKSDLLTDLSTLCDKTHKLLNKSKTAQLSNGSYLSLSTIVAPSHLAIQSLVGIHSAGYFRWQLFSDGLPDVPIGLTSIARSGDDNQIGLLIANKLPTEVLVNLPYRIDEVKTALDSSINFPVEVVEEHIGDFNELVNSLLNSKQ